MCPKAQKHKNHVDINTNSKKHHFINFQHIPFIYAKTQKTHMSYPKHFLYK